MTEEGRAAGPAESAGPAREQVVIRDKRKIDTSSRSRPGSGSKETQAGGRAKDEAADAATKGKAETVTDAAKKGAAAKAEPPAEAPVDSGKPAEPESAGATAGQAPAETGPAEDAAKEAKAQEVKAQEGGAGGPEPAEAETAAEPEATVTAPGAPAGLGAELEAMRTELDERLRDLQRITAEYANYRKRVERDRGLVAEQATGTVLIALLPVLDDLDRAREHGDLVGPFGAVAEQLNAALAKFGLTAFGDKGDQFDPTRHEAVAHHVSDEVTESTCVEIMRRGYVLGDRLLRPALVAVADPE